MAELDTASERLALARSEAAARRFAFLAEAGEILSSSLDYEQTLRDVARLIVPTLGDLCVVDVAEGGQLRRVATAHVDPARAELLAELLRRYPPTPASPQPASRVLRSGQPELLAEVTPDAVAAPDAEHAALIRAIGVRSHLAVPLVARGGIVGVISLAVTESDRRYSGEDLAFALDLARRAALAVDNARLYRAAQEELAQRRRAEEALRLSEARFRAILEQSPLPTQIFAAGGDALRVNRAWERLWGVTQDQLPAYNVLADPQLEARGVAGLLRRAFAGEAVEIPPVRYDPGESLPERTPYAGPARWVRAFAYPIKDEAGAVREVVLVHEDVTARIQAEERLRAGEEASRLLAAAGETLGGSLDYHATLGDLARVVVPRIADLCAIDLLSESGDLERVTIHHADPAKIALAGELFARYPHRRSPPSSAWRVLESGEPERMDVTDEVLRASAQDEEHLRLLREMGLRSHLCVPLTARGARLGTLTLDYAESGRRYTESDVELAKELARRGAAAVDNSRLYQQLRLEDRRKDEFLAILAHELRNPLAPIRTGLEILRRSPTGEAAERSQAMMERQLKHMVRLIDDLLDLSRVTRGKIRLEREPVEVAALVAAALEVSRPALDAAGLELAVRLPAEPLVLDADRTRLAQVVSNLLNNAAKYTDPGGRVEIDAARSGREVTVRVRDTGVGIPREMLAQVFEMFAQVGPSRGRSQGGLGIGLTLVKHLVALHGGRAWAESEGPGRGSTFLIRLPLAPLPSAAPSPAETARDEARAAARRVLVVDDNLDAAESLSMLLAFDGHEVRTAASGPAALEIAQEFRPHVAFLDIGLPGMSGYELAERIRQTPPLAGMLLVALTGWGQEEDRRQSARAGFDHHLTKPIELQEAQVLIAGSGARLA